jgi:hypothetical protein
MLMEFEIIYQENKQKKVLQGDKSLEEIIEVADKLVR